MNPMDTQEADWRSEQTESQQAHYRALDFTQAQADIGQHLQAAAEKWIALYGLPPESDNYSTVGNKFLHCAENAWEYVCDEAWRVRRSAEKPRPKTARIKRRDIPPNQRAIVYARDSLACVACGSSDDLTIDHITPVALGGSDELDNLQTLCRLCNSRKGARV